jgi:hypothetical protein
MVRWLNRLQNQGLAIRATVLGVVVLAEYALVVPVAVHIGGMMSLVAAAVSGALCLTGATLALIASHMLRGPQLAIHALLVSMALRLGVPLGAAVALHFRGGPLAEAGILYYLLVFYPVTLSVETAISLPLVREATGSGPRPSKGSL